MLIGGTFTQVDGVARGLMARLNPDGSLDTGFHPNVSGSGFPYVGDVGLQRDGRIMIAGEFSQVGGVNRTGIARLNPDGSLDTTFNANLDREVFGLSVLPDDSILIGGPFSTVGGAAREHIARLNPDGSVDAGFAPSAGQDDYVYAVGAQADGKVVIGGPFRQVAGVTRERIARLNADGSLDPGFNPGANLPVQTITIQPDGKSIVSGDFTQMGGAARNYLARLNADGTLDTTFIDAGFSGDVQAVDLQPDGKAVVGGDFATAGATARNNIARVLATAPTAAPGAPTARAGDGSAAVSWVGVPGEIASYTVMAFPGGRSCTTSATTSCTVTGLDNGVAHTFRVAARNSFGTGPESVATNPVTPSTTGAGPASDTPAVTPTTPVKKLAGTFRLNRKTRVGTTTGRVPAGVTRIVQGARAPKTRTTRTKRATGKCRITKRNYRCTIKLAKGTWTVTTAARGRAGVVAQGVRKVRVR